MSAVEQLIEKLGGVSATARAFGVAHTSVLKWKRRQELPAERVSHAVTLTGLDASELAPSAAKLAAAFAPQAAE